MNPNFSDDDKWMRLLFVQVKTIAVVGLSHRESKASYDVASFLKQHGFRVIPVNPTPGIILGEAVYPDLASIPVPVDLVNVFRPSADCAEVTGLAIPLKPQAIWLQLGITNDEAASQAALAGIPLVMDRCIKLEYQRLFREKLIDTAR